MAASHEPARAPVRSDLPSGTVTFVFTDIEGSTRLAHDLGTARWSEILAQHASAIREAYRSSGGVEVRTEGDSFFLAFPTARGAIAFAAEAQRALARLRWAHGAQVRVRIGMHTGEGARPGTQADAADYVGYDVHLAARVAAAPHGGQVLVSATTAQLLGDQLPEGTRLRDLGEHRLKDIAQPIRLHQLVIDGLPEEFGPLRTLSAVSNNLPVQLTSFIGRERELAEARELLAGSRLLTLIGPGGTGKSRLSIELATRVMADFPDGVWFIRLAPVTDPALVSSTIAHTLGLLVPAGRTPLDHLLDQLRDKRLLLVIDNFEQVVPAATDLGEILRRCPQVKAIVSTRIALRISGEQEFPVPPLTLPDPHDVPDVGHLAHSEAVQLFVERARAARPAFLLTPENARAVVGIVAQLDGLPLAIELAAARVKILTPQAILERLASGLSILQSSARDLPARQATLNGAIAWSYDLLDDGLKRLFRRLSVFRGGGALEQIETVCGPAEEIGREVLDGVAELVDHSLVRQSASGDEPRFVMLETIREYAHEKLGASGDRDEVELRHAQAYLALAERMAQGLFGDRQKELLDRYELEHANMRIALEACDRASCADRSSCGCDPQTHVADDARVEISLRLAAALWRFWQMRGHLREGRQRSTRVLGLPAAERHPWAYLRALEAAGGVTYWLGDMEATQAHYERRLALARDLGDELAVAEAQYDLSFVYTVPARELDKAQVLLDEALRTFRARGDADGVSKATWALTNVYAQTGRWERAVSLMPEVVAGFRERGNLFGLAWALNNYGIGLVRLGRYDEARGAFVEGLGIFNDAKDTSGISGYLYDFADLAAARGRDALALRLYGAMDALRRSTGTELLGLWSREGVAWGENVRALLERTPPDERERLMGEGAALSLDQAIAFALSDRDAP